MRLESKKKKKICCQQKSIEEDMVLKITVKPTLWMKLISGSFFFFDKNDCEWHMDRESLK